MSIVVQEFLNRELIMPEYHFLNIEKEFMLTIIVKAMKMTLFKLVYLESFNKKMDLFIVLRT